LKILAKSEWIAKLKNIDDDPIYGGVYSHMANFLLFDNEIFDIFCGYGVACDSVNKPFLHSVVWEMNDFLAKCDPSKYILCSISLVKSNFGEVFHKIRVIKA
jgi:hypothetical protein